MLLHETDLGVYVQICLCVGVHVGIINGCLCAMEKLFLTKKSMREKFGSTKSELLAPNFYRA